MDGQRKNCTDVRSSLAMNKMPIEHSAAEIAPTGKRDPFLYNPRLKTSQAGKVSTYTT